MEVEEEGGCGGEEEDDDQEVLERREWFEGKRGKENEKMKMQILIKHLKALCTVLQH